MEPALEQVRVHPPLAAAALPHVVLLHVKVVVVKAVMETVTVLVEAAALAVVKVTVTIRQRMVVREHAMEVVRGPAVQDVMDVAIIPTTVK